MKILLMVLVCQILASVAFAKNMRPSSGRQLQYGHWLTCEGGSGSAVRTSSTLSPLQITKHSSQEDINKDVPQFSGTYSFAVRDTWEEYVTKSGSDCFRCGDTCNGRDDKGNCTSSSCNFCTWQELETFYRPWSTQSTSWKAGWRPNETYRQKHTEWIRNNRPEQPRDLTRLVEFDTDRPNEYYLFPGETEIIQVSNSGFLNILGGGETISPSVSIKNPRSKHDISWTVDGRSPGSRLCDDRDLRVDASISTGNREVTEPPNSIEFAPNFVKGAKDSTGQTEEPFAFNLIDTSAMFYNEQNVIDHFKDTKVVVRLWQEDRWWFLKRSISRRLHIKDTKSTIGFHEEGSSLPPFATYVVKAEDLLQTKWTHKQIHLIPGNTYQICAKMHRKNNVYYRETRGGLEDWSAWNCQVFIYSEKAPDLRTGPRKIKDGFNRWFPVPIYYLFDWIGDPFTWNPK